MAFFDLRQAVADDSELSRAGDDSALVFGRKTQHDDEDRKHDLDFVKELEEEERKEAAAKLHEDELMARKLAHKESVLQEKRLQQKQTVEQADTAIARKLQAQELKALTKEANRILKYWEKPDVVASDAKKGGIIVTGTLPCLGKVSVDLDHEKKMIIVSAEPDFTKFCAGLKDLPAEASPLPLDLCLNLNIIGKERVVLDEIETDYNAKTSVLTITVANAFLSAKTGVLQRAKAGMRRLFSFGK